jgi:hypothetical protein
VENGANDLFSYDCRVQESEEPKIVHFFGHQLKQQQTHKLSRCTLCETYMVSDFTTCSIGQWRSKKIGKTHIANQDTKEM